MQRTMVLAAALAALGGSPAHAEPAPAEPVRLTLDQVIDETLQNPLARAARHATSAARARADEASAARFPVFEITSFLAPSPSIDCVDLPTCTETDPEEATVNIAGVFGGVRAQVTQPIYTFGKLTSISSAARKAAQASAHLEHDVAGDLTEKAAMAYYGLKLARELVWMLEDGLDEIEKGRKKLEERLASGSGEATVQDRLRLETLIAEVEARLTEARQAEAAALAGLRALTGEPRADTDEDLLRPVEFALAAGSGGYLDRARSDRPDLAAARAGVAGVKAKRDFEAARYWPDLVLVGGVNWARADGVDDPPSAFANDPFNTFGAHVAVALRWQINPLSQHARVEQAEADSRRAQALLQAALAGSDLEVKRAYSRAKQANERLEASKRGEKAARGWVASVVQADAIGAASAKELADAYIAYFTVRGRVLQSTYDWNVATVGLRRVIGEFRAAPDRP